MWSWPSPYLGSAGSTVGSLALLAVQRAEKIEALQRNSEFGALMTQLQKQLREALQRTAEAEDRCRRLSVEVRQRLHLPS